MSGLLLYKEKFFKCMSELPVIHEKRTCSQKLTTSNFGVDEYLRMCLAICSYEPLYLYSVNLPVN